MNEFQDDHPSGAGANATSRKFAWPTLDFVPANAAGLP
jgi:hypothetical protein